MLPGGVRTYCDPDNGRFTNEFFTNADCSEQDTDNMYRVFASIPGSCEPPTYPELLVPGIVMDSTGCAPGEAAEYYCKDLASAGLGTEIAAPETSPPTPSPQQTIELTWETTTTGPTQKPTQQTGAAAGAGGEQSSAAHVRWDLCYYLAIALFIFQ